MELEFKQTKRKRKSNIHEIVNNVFKKSFDINCNEIYILPKPESMFVEHYWEIKELQELKYDLNKIKSKLNNYSYKKWHRHTSYRRKAKCIEWFIIKNFRPEFITKAWCKFHEIICKYPLVPKTNLSTNNNKFLSLHLCEAPGAFILCLNHWLKTNAPTLNWDWLAMTLNPYYEGNCNNEMISDDRFIMYTINNWFFGSDYTGNLMIYENLNALIEKFKTKEKVDLITADGSIDCTFNPAEQESIVVNLHFCEVVTAIHLLKTGGNFLLKTFTIFEHQSICLVYFLSCIFKRIHFYKPVTSGEGNSEVYIICLEFKGLDIVLPYLPKLTKEFERNSNKAMFKENDIPINFLNQIISCSQFFKNYQCQVIENNIMTFSTDKFFTSNSKDEKIAELVANQFMINFPLQKLHNSLHIVGRDKLMKKNYQYWHKIESEESFNDIQKNQLMKPVNRLLMYKNRLNYYLESFSEPIVFKSTKDKVDINIDIGRPFQRIQSSRFCSKEALIIFKLIFQTVDMKENILLSIPSKKVIVEYELKMQQFWNNMLYKTLYFQYTEIWNNDKTITSIKNTIKSLQKGDNLVLFGFLLLTQFNVGLIYLLACTFDSVKFILNKEIGCSMIFHDFKNNELILQNIEQIYETSKDAIKSNKIAFTIFPILELYDSELCNLVFTFNNWIAQYCVNCISSIYDERNNGSSLEV